MKRIITYGLILMMISVKTHAQVSKTIDSIKQKVATGKAAKKTKGTTSNTDDAQRFFSIKEVDENGSTVTFQPDYRVVDPNSVLNLTIDTAALISKAGATLSPDITVKLKKLVNMLAAEKESIDNVKGAIIAYQQGRPKQIWQPLLKKQGDFARLILKDPDNLSIYNSVPKDTSIVSQYEALFKAASIIIGRLKDQIVSQAKTNGVYVQLGAWLETSKASTPIHIPGFDSYTPQPASSVQRFQLVLTDDQKAQLQQISAFADTANSEGLGRAILNATQNSGQILTALENLQSYKDLTALWTSLNKLADSTQVKTAAVKTALQDAANAINTYKNNVDALIAKYKSPQTSTDGNQLLLQVNTDVGLLQSQTSQLSTSLQNDFTTINGLVAAETADVQTQIKTDLPILQKIGGEFKTDLSSIGSQEATFISQLLLGKGLAETSYDFTNQVNQLSINQLNNTAIIDLTTAGQRNQGDQVTIKIAMGKAGVASTELETEHYKLYFCGLYANTAVGFLFVSPTPVFKRTGDNAFFRYAPSYSILLRGIFASEKTARTSVSYHSIWEPGIGLNFSALDFNNTGSVQLGIGGVFSIFQDFLQFGYGINTFDGRGYAFFGFKLPVGSFTIH